MKKILIINHGSTYGGAGISIEQIVNAIDRTQFRIQIYNNSDLPTMANQFINQGYDVIKAYGSPVTFSHYNGASFFFLSPIVLKNLYRIHKDKKTIDKLISTVDPDIVIVNSMTLFWIGKIIKKYGKQAICFHRESYTNGIFGIRTKIIKKGLNKYFDKIAYISKYDLEQTSANNTINKVIYDKVDVNKYAASEEKNVLRGTLGFKKEFLILYLGGVSKLKGAETILKAMSYITAPDIKLIFLQSEEFSEVKKISDCKGIKNKLYFILGKDIEYEISKMIFEYSLQNKVIFKPSTLNVQDYFKACDVVVFPSTEAHQARPIYEAGVARIPIIITDFPNTKEFIKDGITGFEFKCNDSLNLSSKIIDVYNNYNNINDIVQRNYDNTIHNHNIGDLKIEVNDFLNI